MTIKPPGAFSPGETPTFEESAKRSLANSQLRRNLGKATRTIREKRAAAVAEMPDWEELREAGRALKSRVMRHLDEYLLQLEESVQRAGGHVHWARDAAEANRIIAQVAKDHDAREVVKVKSIATDETGLNEHLEREGITAHETDLAELIIQLAGETSSHILVPAIHKNRAEIRDLFEETRRKGPLRRPEDLTNAARLYLREKFLSAKVGISGPTSLSPRRGPCASSSPRGTAGCARRSRKCSSRSWGSRSSSRPGGTSRSSCSSSPLLDRGADEPVHLVLDRGQEGDGPQEFHLVLLDNGRTDVLEDQVGRQALNCIRCSACLNVCPVYERTGGHAYNSVYPGPIGAILTPQLVGSASGGLIPCRMPPLCGACYEVCPVKINIPEVLIHLRGRVVRRRQDTEDRARSSTPRTPRCSSWRRSSRTAGASKGPRSSRRWASGRWRGEARSGASRQARRLDRRARPEARPDQTFREWWKANRGGA